VTYAFDIVPDAARVLSNAVARIAELWVLSDAKFGAIIGLPESSASQLRAGHQRLEHETEPFERAQYLLQLFHSLDSWLSQDQTSVRSWLAAENLVLGAAPADIIVTVKGLLRTIAYVDAIRFPN
jgi:Protein of unknown function (DUF2384)